MLLRHKRNNNFLLTKKKKELDLQIKEKERDIAALEMSYKRSLQHWEAKLSELKQDHELLLSKRANNYRFNSNKASYLMANKPGKHLTVLAGRIQTNCLFTF